MNDVRCQEGSHVEALCFDCRFFSPEGPVRVDDLTEQDWDEGLAGECRKNLPCAGRFRGEEETLEYDYGQWPLVLAGDWCGEFEPCCRALARDEEPTRDRRAYRLVDPTSADDRNGQPRHAVGRSQEA